MAIDTTASILRQLPESKRTALFKFLNSSARTPSPQDDTASALYMSIALKAAVETRHS